MPGRGLRARIEGHEVRVGNVRFISEAGIGLGAAGARLTRHRSRGRGTQLVAVDGEVWATFSTADVARPESRRVLAELSAQGRRTLLLSGDAPESVARVQRDLGLEEAIGGLLPDEKAARVKALKQEGHVVAMVGDGINDVPALALADVGISLHGGTEVALEAADVVLLEGGLARLPEAFRAGERTLRQVHRGVALVLVPNLLGMGLAAVGWLPPVLAAALNNGSTVVAALAALAPLSTRR